jgi:hypothetical protein
MREALRDIRLPTSFACLVLLDGLFARRRHADSHVALCRDGSRAGFIGRPVLDMPARFSALLPTARRAPLSPGAPVASFRGVRCGWACLLGQLL